MNIIRVGLTEAHGMAKEVSQCAPPDVQYSFLRPLTSSHQFIRSPIKGYLRRYEAGDHDLIEAVMTPVVTDSPWIYLCENLPAATAFNVLGMPLPRAIRVAYIRRLLLRSNCKKVIFWSQAGYRTLASYGGLDADDRLARKATVVYPAVRRVSDDAIGSRERGTNLLFSGAFFRKGGVHVIDAFARARQIYPSLQLTLCCDENIDFETPNAALRKEYLEKIRHTDGIIMRGRIDRDELIRDVLPKTGIYLLPTYLETFGMSVLEAMAFGIPVIATNHFAIPEMLEHQVSGLLIDTSQFDCERMFRGYVVDKIPSEFREYMTEQVFMAMRRLLDSTQLGNDLGRAGLAVARTRFSFDVRNERMREIYREALQ